jgi:hypothetical protein
MKIGYNALIKYKLYWIMQSAAGQHAFFATENVN